MDDIKKISITAPDGTKLRATPFSDDQIVTFSAIRGADTELVMAILTKLFTYAFGDETYRQFILRMAGGDATATLRTMVELLGSVVTTSKSGTEETKPGLTPVVPQNLNSDVPAALRGEA